MNGIDYSIDFLPGAKHLSVVDKSVFADILGEATWSHNCSVEACSSV